MNPADLYQPSDLTAPGDDVLREISALGSRLLLLQKEVAAIMASLDRKTEELNSVKNKLLPDAMAAAGLESFKLADGTLVEVSPYYVAKIPEHLRETAFKWLEDHGASAIIKNEVKMTFGKGQEERAREAMTILAEAGFDFNNKEDVHPQTLKAFVRERIEEGNPVPPDLFGVQVGKTAKIKNK